MSFVKRGKQREEQRQTPTPAPDCHTCKHKGLEVLNIYCKAIGRPMTPSSVTACSQYTPVEKDE